MGFGGLQKVDDAFFGHHSAVGVLEAATPVVGAKRFGEAVGPHLDSAVRNHAQCGVVAVDGLDQGSKSICFGSVPVHKDVDALQFFGFGRFALVLRNLNLRVAAVAYGLELAGFL